LTDTKNVIRIIIRVEFPLLIIQKVGCVMAVWKCTVCGETKEGRCRPQKCPKCGATKEKFEKQQ
jgi:rubrerythrin